ncbi:MAG: sugar transferase [Burkholderiaceae bacterium]|nr:sugar transferase [Burkholderiaceae bacterium]
MSKRLFDLVLAGVGLVVLAPVFAAIALWIKLDSPGPVFFRQVRIGQHGKPFRIHKFRTMVPSSGTPLQLTVGEDSRITRSGRFLRRLKLDELAQLVDVVQGSMSLVGPRPEVPKYVSLYPDDVRAIVLSVKPGITDSASIRYRNESEILARAADPEREYTQTILPAKLQHYVQYVKTRTLAGDLGIILQTLGAILR